MVPWVPMGFGGPVVGGVGSFGLPRGCPGVVGCRRHWAVGLVLAVGVVLGGSSFGCRAPFWHVWMSFGCYWVIVGHCGSSCGHRGAVVGMWLVVVVGCEVVVTPCDTVVTVSYCELTVVTQSFNVPKN